MGSRFYLFAAALTLAGAVCLVTACRAMGATVGRSILLPAPGSLAADLVPACVGATLVAVGLAGATFAFGRGPGCVASRTVAARLHGVAGIVITIAALVCVWAVLTTHSFLFDLARASRPPQRASIMAQDDECTRLLQLGAFLLCVGAAAMLLAGVNAIRRGKSEIGDTETPPEVSVPVGAFPFVVVLVSLMAVAFVFAAINGGQLDTLTGSPKPANPVALVVTLGRVLQSQMAGFTLLAAAGIVITGSAVFRRPTNRDRAV